MTSKVRKLWEEIEQQEDIKEWYNQVSLDDEDVIRLHNLAVVEKAFAAFDCGHCGSRVRVGLPSSWDNFQGVCQDEHLGELCGDCGALYLSLEVFAE